MNQLSMTGDDWTSDRDRKAKARADANVKKTAIAAAKKLETAADALNEFLSACLDADHPDTQGAGDGRRTLVSSMMEYSGYLESVYGRRS